MPGKIITVEHLNCRYNSVEVLSDISFAVEAGDYVGFVGPNGSGKTTLVKAILRLIRQESGTVSLFGKDLGEFTRMVQDRLPAPETQFPEPEFSGNGERSRLSWTICEEEVSEAP